RRLAQRNGFDDVLFTHAGTAISEAATSNVGFLTGNRVIWPNAPCLPGVTMRLINEVLDTQASTAPITLSELAGVDAAVATNAAIGIRPVAAIDGIRFPTDHPMIDTLGERYAEIPPELV
ncbi:MAG: aminotransferase class IV, partial [Actinomycetota bacterium]|nr:aminotransferase class IV [Actinomycetota bacterium]